MSPSSRPTPAPERGERLLRRVIVALALLTAAATIEKAVRLSAPMPTAEAPASLRLAGYRINALPSARPPQRGRELSHGSERRFRLVPLTGQPELTLTLLPVRTRTATDLSAETMGGKGLSLDTVGALVPGFALKEKRIVSVQVLAAKGSTPRNDQLALGRGEGDRAGATTRLQTCLTPSSVAAVNATSLAGEGEAPPRPGDPPPLMRRLQRVAGLSQTRHECLAVQLETAPSPAGGAATDPQERLQRAWQDLRGVLTGPS
ncbi:MAG: hypothetical protein ACK5Q7_07500 [Cyanobacteriota bacterium]